MKVNWCVTWHTGPGQVDLALASRWELWWEISALVTFRKEDAKNFTFAKMYTDLLLHLHNDLTIGLTLYCRSFATSTTTCCCCSPSAFTIKSTDTKIARVNWHIHMTPCHVSCGHVSSLLLALQQEPNYNDATRPLKCKDAELHYRPHQTGFELITIDMRDIESSRF